MLDTVVVEHYPRTLGEKRLRSSAAALGWFREDLLAAAPEVKRLQSDWAPRVTR
jgi:hypothetical protein